MFGKISINCNVNGSERGKLVIDNYCMSFEVIKEMLICFFFYLFQKDRFLLIFEICTFFSYAESFVLKCNKWIEADLSLSIK